MSNERQVRTSGATGVRIDRILSTVLVSELMTPSRSVWLVSPWIGDIDAVDNSSGAYDSVFTDPSNRIYALAEVLGRLTDLGTRLSVVTRPDPYNDTFVDRLTRQVAKERLHVVRAEDVHEKTFCGDDWLMTGSMNFTFRGMTINDELISYGADAAVAATAQVEFAQRFSAAG